MTYGRSARLDSRRVAAALARETGIRLVVEGPCPGGQVGAAHVRWPDGRRGVLTWRPGITLAEADRGPLAVAAALRASGYPAPATELAADTSDGLAVVQELLPGSPPPHVGEKLLDQALELSQRQTGALAGHPGIPAYPLYLREDGPGYCLHGPLRGFSPRAAALEGRIAAAGRTFAPQLAGDDAVHGDFHQENLLVRDGRISGVIDTGSAWPRPACETPQPALSSAGVSSVPSSGKSSGSTSSGAQSGAVPVMARSRATRMASVKVGRSNAP